MRVSYLLKVVKYQDEIYIMDRHERIITVTPKCIVCIHSVFMIDITREVNTIVVHMFLYQCELKR